MDLTKFLKSDAKRDLKWQHEFFSTFLESDIYLKTDAVQAGPDGFPYLFLSSDSGEAKDRAQRLLSWGFENGVGLVLNPEKEEPDYVFSYGEMWNFFANGEFLTQMEAPKAVDESGLISGGETVFCGEPNEAYWPDLPRKWFREYLVQQSVLKPRVVLISKDKENYDLAFSLESLGSPPEGEHEGILMAFSWFFPRHYSLAIVEEKHLKGAPFVSV